MKTDNQLTQFQSKVLFDGLESVRNIYSDEPEVFSYIVRVVEVHEELLGALKATLERARNGYSPDKDLLAKAIAKAESPK